jgi:hypothetical protein
MVFRRIHKIVTSFPQQNDRLYRRKSLQMNNTWQRKHSYFVIWVIQLWKKVPMLYMIYGFFAILQVFAFLYSTKLLLNFQFRVLKGLGKGLYFATNLCSTAHFTVSEQVYHPNLFFCMQYWHRCSLSSLSMNNARKKSTAWRLTLLSKSSG